MKRLLYLVLAIVFMVSCKKEEVKSFLPANFNNMTTEQKMDFLMKEKSPDSVALFICEIAMGNVKGTSIELNQAELYAFEKYPEDKLIPFLEGMKKYENTLPLDKKMKLVKLASMEDPDLYSYELGLSYVGSIREDKKDIKSIKKELEDFKKATATDPEFYRRFMKGFKLALEEDRHRDLDDKIYLEFINYQE